jgi:hypothetical protein
MGTKRLQRLFWLRRLRQFLHPQSTRAMMPPDCRSIPHDPLDPLTCRPTLLDADDQFPEFSSDTVQFALPALPLTPGATDLPSSAAYLVRALSRSALRMLWHQRLGHI